MQQQYVYYGWIWAIVCYNMAKNRNRNPYLGILGGGLFGLGAVIYYWIVKEKKTVKPKIKKTSGWADKINGGK